MGSIIYEIKYKNLNEEYLNKIENGDVLNAKLLNHNNDFVEIQIYNDDEEILNNLLKGDINGIY